MSINSIEAAKQSVIYIPQGAHSSVGIDESRYVREYDHWHLVLMPEDDREKRGIAAGLFIAKRAVSRTVDLLPEEMADVLNVIQTAPQLLCEKVGSSFTDDFVWGFNNGILAGQTQDIVHGHIYPVTADDLPTGRNGMGAMQETNRREQGK